ncbi:sugar transporter [Aquicoccus sp. G2-2]|uniref:sugar transporter n=1 Tax=Aquicoccus sp. G2-2 TaxID=3092120 RepID=UPI002ADF0646|nr:sugar transporter [Aquicoccus sp. G2-2]MEA1115078.1 sugar transporter [Aquicoccus sp. G2-2]
MNLLPTQLRLARAVPLPAHRPAHMPTARAPGPGAALPGVAPRARLHRRHRAIIASFASLVLFPLLFSAWYLFVRAADQYVSQASFTVRSERSALTLGALEGLSALTAFSGGSSTETALLRSYLTSQALVSRVERELHISALWSAAPGDPVFAYHPSGTIEDLTGYWPRMVHISDNPGSGILTVSVRAFSAIDAQRIAQAVEVASTEMINHLADQAQAETLRFAGAELIRAQARLATARSRLAAFRAETGMVDPKSDVTTETGVLGMLQGQLAEALVEQAMLDTEAEAASARRNAVNRAQKHEVARRITVLRARIKDERTAVGAGEARDFSAQLAQYERLETDLEFAREAYLTTRKAHEAARAEASHQSFYLASFAPPPLAQRALYPRRWLILGVGALFLLLGWAVIVLSAAALRDRT